MLQQKQGRDAHRSGRFVVGRRVDVAGGRVDAHLHVRVAQLRRATAHPAAALSGLLVPLVTGILLRRAPAHPAAAVMHCFVLFRWLRVYSQVSDVLVQHDKPLILVRRELRVRIRWHRVFHVRV